jgi:hypothetical protein
MVVVPAVIWLPFASYVNDVEPAWVSSSAALYV